MEETIEQEPVGRLCPRCGKPDMYWRDVLNSLSRRDNKTYICNGCGMEEALFDMHIGDWSSSPDYDEHKVKILKARESAWLILKEIKEERENTERENQA